MPSTATSILDGLSTSVAVKAPCRTATTANITLSGLQTVGGVALAENDRVLVKDQSTASQNGIYSASTGSWTRTKDFDGNRDVRSGTFVIVANSGTNIYYRVTTADPIVIGTSSINFEIVSGSLTQSTVGAVLYPQTTAELAASFTPVNLWYPPGDSRRAALDVSGTTDVTSLLQQMLNAAGLAASNGDVKEVVLYPGTYKVTRLKMRYSNVFLRIMAGATIQQTRTGITDSATVGVAPDYAVIHINPLTYVHSPASGAAGTLTNVKVYGGGTVKGPFTTTGAYNAFSMGIVSNDCHSCVLDNIKVMDCRAENVLHGNSSWNTVTGVKIINCEFEGGGEVGINNARAFELSRNYVHDSWMMNGLGGNGDNGLVCDNIIRNMYQGGMTIGGSGARDINECRNVLYARNVLHNTGTGSTTGYALFMTDDGATTVPKKNLRVVGNIFSLHQGAAVMACDYADSAGVIDIDGNTITGGTAGSPGAGLAFIGGAATYNVRNNTIYPGSGNQDRGIDVLGGTPVVHVLDGNRIYGHATASIQGVTDFTLYDDYGSFTGTLTGVSGSVTGTLYYARRRDGKHVILHIPGITGASTSTACTITGLPAALWPTRAQNHLMPITDNSVSALGFVQIGTNGVITLFSSIAGAGFTAANNKGTTGPYSVPYVLN